MLSSNFHTNTCGAKKYDTNHSTVAKTTYKPILFKLYGTGACGKGYKEWVKTSIGGPYLKVRLKLG